MRYEGSMYFTSASLKRFLISLFSQGPTSFRMGLPLRSVWTSPDIKISCSMACITLKRALALGEAPAHMEHDSHVEQNPLSFCLDTAHMHSRLFTHKAGMVSHVLSAIFKAGMQSIHGSHQACSRCVTVLQCSQLQGLQTLPSTVRDPCMTPHQA